MQKNPIAGYRFYVYVGRQGFGFQQITSIEESIETETIIEGGRSYAKALVAPPKSIKKMTFKKGCGTFDEQDFPFKVGQYLEDSIQIFVLGTLNIDKENGKTVVKKPIAKQYEVLGALVTSWNISDLDAQSSNILIESFEVQYEELKRII